MKILRIVLISIFIILLCAICIFAQAPDTLWTKTFGGASGDWGFSVQQIFDGGYIIAGGTASFGAGDTAAYLIKTDSIGDLVWTNTYGGTGYDEARSVQQISDGGYIIAGYTSSFGAGGSDVWLLKTDSLGDTLWTKTYGGTDDEWSNSAAQTSDGGYIIAGGTRSFGSGEQDVYLIKTDSLGDTLWTKTFGGTDDDYGSSVDQTFDGGYIIAGSRWWTGPNVCNVYLIKTDSLGNTLWEKMYGGSSSYAVGFSVQQTTDSGYIVAGTIMPFPAECYGYLIKTDTNGDTLWTEKYGEGGYNWLTSIQQTTDDGYIITGFEDYFGAGGLDVWLIKTDVNGDSLWMKSYGGTVDDVGYSIQQTADEGYIITGFTSSFGVGNGDVWLIKTEPDVGIEEQTDPRYETTDLRLFCHPNPFRERIEIQLYGVSEYWCIGESELQIFDVTGRRVRDFILYPSSFILGATWDGRDEAGQVLPPGIYFLKLNSKPAGKVVKVR